MRMARFQNNIFQHSIHAKGQNVKANNNPFSACVVSFPILFLHILISLPILFHWVSICIGCCLSCNILDEYLVTFAICNAVNARIFVCVFSSSSSSVISVEVVGVVIAVQNAKMQWTWNVQQITKKKKKHQAI